MDDDKVMGNEERNDVVMPSNLTSRSNFRSLTPPRGILKADDRLRQMKKKR